MRWGNECLYLWLRYYTLFVLDCTRTDLPASLYETRFQSAILLIPSEDFDFVVAADERIMSSLHRVFGHLTEID